MSLIRASWLGRRGIAAVLAAVALVAFAGCGQSPAPAPPAAPESPPAPPAADPALSRLFSRIAGLPDRTPPAGPDWTSEPAWKAFTEETGRNWEAFDRAVLGPMKDWAGRELEDARRDTTTLFYPFGGPDFVTSDALFPGAVETVLMGLEPVGNLPDLDRATAKRREEFFADMGELTAGFLKRGYFITKDMNEIYSRGRVDGALPVVAYFLARQGYGIVEVKRLVPAGDGGWTETPYERAARRPRRPYGVKIVCLKPGETTARNVYYFCCDVENKAFRTDAPLYRLFAGFGRLTTFVKSGSYLLHWGNFSTLRRFILDRSLYVLQDDTAVPYRFFVDEGWDIRLYGRYGKPVSDFTNVEQADLRQAYEAPSTGVLPLPFHFGYHWRSQVDNLLLAKRPHRPDKVPSGR
ncbi:MAG TPA: hypothetical protein P5119_11305 [Candidatus Aminicenantes bacterium]|nr:hypothetical protein [Candidatus Aminicenantes bacterium]HRY65911.1 hypothetical protein [Candidatus Aminicenantes bacterium]HRZ72763.1 hypothetical protein [Candidatus Aminicenantes bacterium]